MPRTAAKPWERQIRQMVKASQGSGWLLRAGRGDRTQAIRCWDDGTRSSVTLPIPWHPSSGTTLLALTERLAAVMAMHQLGLAEAAELVAVKEGDTPAAIREGVVDWQGAAEKFRGVLLASGTMTPRTYGKNVGTYVKRVLQVLGAPTAPKDGRATLEAIISKTPLKPGCPGRRRMLDGASRFLTFAVESCGASVRYRPPADRSSLVGYRLDSPTTGTPLLDEQLLRLLSGISDSRWRLAVGLAGTFGLRPAELGSCRTDGSALRVEGVKRNSSGRAASRLVLPLDPCGASGLGAELLAQLAKRGEEALPAQQANWAGAFFHHLKKHVPIWAEIHRESSDANQGHLTVYGLRHGFAWRGSQLYGLSPRVLAALMGHTVAVHLQHYGRWASEAETAAAVSAAVNRVRLA